MSCTEPAGNNWDSTIERKTCTAMSAVAVAGLMIIGNPASSVGASFSSIPQTGNLMALMKTAEPRRERGLHNPTLRVLVQIGDALQVSVAEILRTASTAEPSDNFSSSAPIQRVEDAIRVDPNLTTLEKDALLTVYRSCLASDGDDASIK